MNISENSEGVFFTLDTREVHHKRNQIPTVSLSQKLSWLLSVKKQISSFSTLFIVGQRVMFRKDMVTFWSKLSSIDWLEQIVLKTKTGNNTQHYRCHFVSFLINVSGARFN